MIQYYFFSTKLFTLNCCPFELCLNHGTARTDLQFITKKGYSNKCINIYPNSGHDLLQILVVLWSVELFSLELMERRICNWTYL